MSEALQTLTEMRLDLEHRTNDAYDKMTEAKTAYTVLGAELLGIKRAIEVLEGTAAVSAALVAPAAPAKFTPAPAPARPARPDRASSDEGGRKRRDVRGEVLEEFKRAGAITRTKGEVRAALKTRGAITAAQVENAFEYWAKKSQIVQVSEKSWRHHAAPAPGFRTGINRAGDSLDGTFAPEPDMENAHYADADAGEAAGNGADEDYVAPILDADLTQIVELLDAAGDEGLTFDELGTYGVRAAAIERAEKRRVISQESGRYYVTPEG